jgi:hypothetical protein
MPVYTGSGLKISIEGKTICFEGKDIIAKPKAASFDLTSVTKVSLYFRPSRALPVDSSFNSSNLRNLLFKDYKTTFSPHLSSGSGTLIPEYPYPVALFFIDEMPAFYIDINTGPGKEKPLFDLLGIIGKEKFDASLHEVFTNEFRTARDAFNSPFYQIIVGFVFLALMMSFLLGSQMVPGFFFLLYNKNPNAYYIFNPLMIFLIFLSLIPPLILSLSVNRIFFSKDVENYAEKHPELVRGSTKFQNRIFERSKLPLICLYLSILLICSTSSYELKEDMIQYNLLFMKTGEADFSKINILELDCGIKKENDSPRYNLLLKMIDKSYLTVGCNDPILQGKLCLSDEQVRSIISKISPGYSVQTRNCPGSLKTEVMNQLKVWGITNEND